MYHDIFASEFNFQFGYPKSDMWYMCWQYRLWRSSDAEKAQAGYSTMHYDHKLSKKSWEAVKNWTILL